MRRKNEKCNKKRAPHHGAKIYKNALTKRVHACDIVHQDYAVCTTVVTAGERPKSLLSGRIPDGELDLFIVDLQVFDFKIHANGRLNVFVECVVGESKEHTGLYNSNSGDRQHG